MTAPALKQYQQGQGSVSADNLNSMEQTCDTISQLRAFVGTIGNQVFVRGSVAVGDGGGGQFYWSSTATGPDNGTTIIVPNGVLVGAWVLLPSGNPFIGDVETVTVTSGALTLSSSFGSMRVINNSNAALNVNPPPSPYIGQRILMKDWSFNAGTYPWTFTGILDLQSAQTLIQTNGGYCEIEWDGANWSKIRG